ncbi:MAG TPA: zinc ribbon domain-containing protein [Dehalococcoidia bacterium]|nr:zinc ribbon domain-containing protein [Dehalococcoidia bacterium]
MSGAGPGIPPDGVPVFSPRLDEVLDAIRRGEAPNAGRFCGYCFTPLAERDACAHCGRSAAEVPPADRIPREIFEMYRALRRRESLVVNSFAYLGLTIGVALFVGMVAIAVFYLNAAWWFLTLSIVVLLVGGRVLAGILGGIIGDNLGYRYARRKLAEDWAAYEASRRPPPSP